MNHRKSMHIFWFTLCLLLAAGTLIIAAVQYQFHKKGEQESRQKIQDTQKAGITGAKPDSGLLADTDTGSVLQGSQDAESDSDSQIGKEYVPEAGTGIQPANGTAQTYRFELRVTDGYLDVYYYRTQQLYFHTGISYQTLSASQRKDADHGKYFENEQDLYGYLESCTS